jgi:hypothetical protein
MLKKIICIGQTNSFRKISGADKKELRYQEYVKR